MSKSNYPTNPYTGYNGPDDHMMQDMNEAIDDFFRNTDFEAGGEDEYQHMHSDGLYYSSPEDETDEEE